ncbi:MAG TPA: hypothetical protein VN641_18690 [Urbifossiella sp.]|nr:hypothetical protein [Urbifossiella sp.]
MADVTITAANVQTSSAQTKSGIAGVAITAGQSLYQSAADSNKLHLAKADTSIDAACVGVALNNAAAGQPVFYQAQGLITIGGTVVIGTPYVVSGANAGGIAPWSDLVTGNKVTFIGYATTAGILNLAIQNTGVASP